ncbi:MAG: cell division protein SepF [Methanotrichaceae archaeon]|nr:cell division protein SepF [Methanotrichaceae archaeon]
MVKFLDKLMGKSGGEEYVEVDLGQFEEVNAGRPEMYLRLAELNSMDVLPEIKQEIYAGNILMVDISPLKRDKNALDRAVGELRRAVEDVSGDIAGIGDDLVVVVPGGIKIDRDRVVGGAD